MYKLIESVKNFNELHGNHVALDYKFNKNMLNIYFMMDFQNHKMNSPISKIYSLNIPLILEYFVMANYEILVDMFKLFSAIDTIQIKFVSYIDRTGYFSEIKPQKLIVIKYPKIDEIIIYNGSWNTIKKIK